MLEHGLATLLSINTNFLPGFELGSKLGEVQGTETETFPATDDQ